MKKFLKTGLGMLCAAVVVCIVLAFCGMLVNSAGHKVTYVEADMDALYTEMYKDSEYKPSRLKIGTEKNGMVNAKLTGYLYMPKGVSKDNPAPAVVLTHGYLNSKEYIEPFAIELARRGIIAFVYDQYDHGTSTWDTPAAFNFFQYSAYDALTWMSQQEYVLKNETVAMVGATGHSMGGFSSEIAAAFDAADVAAGQSQKCVAILAMGADFRYSGAVYTAYGTRSAGALASEYDEFFFDNSKNAKGTVIKKNYLADSVGMALLGIDTEGVNKQWYKVDPLTTKAYEGEAPEVGYGERIIYNEKGDHPYNTWSPEAVGDVCDFYLHAFEYQAKLHGISGYTPSTKKGSAQVWALKEVFTCLSLIVLIGGIIAAIAVTAKVPFLRYANTEENKGLYDGTTELKPQSGAKKGIATVISAVSIGFGFYFLTTLMDRNADGLATLNTYTKYALIVVAFAIALIGIAYLVVKSREDNEKAKTIFGRIGAGLAILVVSLFAFKWLLNDGATVIANIGGSKWFNAPSVNTIVYWAMAAGVMGLIFAVISTLVAGHEEVKFVDALGIRANFRQILVACLKGLALCLVVFLFIFLIGVIFKTDFRVYTYAFKAQMAAIAWKSWLRYVPLFFVFYLAAGMAISASTIGKKGWKADLVAVLLQVLPSAIFLLYQYTVLETTGTAPYVNFALNGILVQGLIPTLIFLAVIQRRSLEKTGNIWTGVFFNTFFFTLITISNTTLYNLAK